MRNVTFVYLREGNGEEPCAYQDYQDACRDVEVDYPNAGGVQFVKHGSSLTFALLASGGCVTITRIRLFERKD